MPSEVQDERIFENAVDLTPEQEQDNKAYFEGKGVAMEFPADDAQDKKAPEGAKVADTTTVLPDGGGAPAVGEAPAVTDADEVIDPETQAAWHSAKNDKERLGYNARRTKKIKEMEAEKAELVAEKAENSRKIAELEGVVNGMRAAQSATAPPTQSLTNAAEQPKVEKTVEPPKPREFSEPKPVRPKEEDFLDQDDPRAAWLAADTDYLEARDTWRDRKTEFDNTEKKRLETDTAAEKAMRAQVDEKFERGRKAHADFDARTAATDYGPMLPSILMFDLPDGEELAYHLSSPEHAEDLLRLRAMTHPQIVGESTKQKYSASLQAVAALAEFRLKVKGLLAPPPTEPKAAAVAPPPAPVPAVVPASIPPTPRKETAMPPPVRGVNAPPAEKYEDIDPEDYDARKDWRKKHGVL